mgnify:FL=1
MGRAIRCSPHTRLNKCREPIDSKEHVMKIKAILATLLLCGGMVYAQTDDVTIMTINGQPISKSEFEYSYNKNNAEGVIDKKSVDEYVDLFINYKLKVAAALDAHLDTLSSFKKEFATYRDQQIRPAVITDADVEAEAKRIYSETQHRIDSLGGLFRPAHILLLLSQQASDKDKATAEQRIDSIYTVLKKGADFAEMAKKYSQDPGSASQGGLLPWLTKGQTLKEFENQVMALKVGQMSKPFLSPAGYHIILLKDKKMFDPYDSVRNDILRFIDARGLKERIIDNKLQLMAAQEGNGATPQTVLAEKEKEMESSDSDLKNLIREYHDGLLLFEISTRMVWDKAAKDEAGLQAYFKKNKKNYKWEVPRFKGMAYHVKTQEDVKAVKDCVKGLSFDKWAEKLRSTFNNDSTIRIRVEKGLFKQGDNPLVDRDVFGKNTEVKPLKDYPIDAVYGKVIKAPQALDDVRGLVTADYQDALEKEWVASLRKKYPVVVDHDVLATVNKK